MADGRRQKRRAQKRKARQAGVVALAATRQRVLELEGYTPRRVNKMTLEQCKRAIQYGKRKHLQLRQFTDHDLDALGALLGMPPAGRRALQDHP